MNHRTRLYLIVGISALVVFSALSGCGDQNAASHPTTVSESVALVILDYDGIQNLITSNRGKVIVMDCWATSCPPCVEEFSKLVALHKKYNPNQVVCISLSFDFEGLGKPEDVQADVLKFLHAQGATFDNVLNAESSETLLKKMNLPSIPAVFVYDRQGNVHRFEGSNAYDAVPGLVEKLIAAP